MATGSGEGSEANLINQECRRILRHEQQILYYYNKLNVIKGSNSFILLYIKELVGYPSVIKRDLALGK